MASRLRAAGVNLKSQWSAMVGGGGGGGGRPGDGASWRRQAILIDGNDAASAALVAPTSRPANAATIDSSTTTRRYHAEDLGEGAEQNGDGQRGAWRSLDVSSLPLDTASHDTSHESSHDSESSRDASFDDVWDAEADPMVRARIVPGDELDAALARMDTRRPVMVTLANDAFHAMLLNWWFHVSDTASIPNVLAGALDRSTAELCRQRGIPHVRLRTGLPSDDFRADAGTFQRMGVCKTALLAALLERARDVVLSDTDVVWLRDPYNELYLGSMRHADVMVSSDSLSHANDEARRWGTAVVLSDADVVWLRDLYIDLYLGNMRHADVMVSYDLLSHANDEARPTDQHGRGGRVVPGGDSAGQGGVWERVRARVQHGRAAAASAPAYAALRPRLAPRHEPVSQQQQQQRVGVRVALPPPLAVHNTFQFHHALGKAARFREAGLWAVDPPEYYEEGNYLSMEYSTPPWIIAMEPGMLRHQAAMEHFYHAAQKAFALAWLLSRKLILPRVTCFCDRWWDSLSHPCRAPGSDRDPPFLCPVDYLISPLYWGSNATDMVYRPASFLEDPRTSDEIKASRRYVSIDYPDASSLQYHQQQSHRQLQQQQQQQHHQEQQQQQPPDPLSVYGELRLPMNATDKEVLAVLGQPHVHEVRVLHLLQPHDTFCRFVGRSDAEAFDAYTWQFFSQDWCCTPNHETRTFSIPPIVNVSFSSCNRPSLDQTPVAV
ncbi:unnamed protein product [Closterium sp. Yama58-4]|nr:unnamed protein product [Closterium sp. Yama58-4]